jgi:hypothetical protein
MASLHEELEEIINHAKGNFFPTSMILRNALVVAKKIEDKHFEEVFTKELKGYKSGPLPTYRRLRGQVVVMTRFGPYESVSTDHLDNEARCKVSTAHLAETVPIIEDTLNSEGETGILGVAFSLENDGVLPPIPNKTGQYGILLGSRQLRELLDDVRTAVLDWAINKQRNIVTNPTTTATVKKTTADKFRLSPVQYLKENKQWIFSGVGIFVISTVAWFAYTFLSSPSDQNNANAALISTTTATPAQPPTRRFEDNAPPLSKKITPSPLQIFDAIRNAPPLQQDELAKNYLGLKVDWTLKFQSARKLDDDSVHISLLYADEIFPLIQCDVSLSKYRELNIMNRGADIRVVGTIDRVRYSTIYLKDTTLFY